MNMFQNAIINNHVRHLSLAKASASNYVQRTETELRETCEREAPAIQPSATHAEAYGHGHGSAQADYGTQQTYHQLCARCV